MRVVATAGHVDHGKSTLVRALTGVDPDRLAEEKQRGMTIDLGFAATTLPSGAEIGFVDVPGHGRFVKNMLAGVGSADACLFVVAATEGWKAQSEEHLRILELVGVSHGVVALTKVDVAGEELTELATMEVEEKTAGTFLDGAPVVRVAVPARIGVDDLRHALDGLVAETPASPDQQRPRMWVDRSFAIKGSGTVVTGTLAGGSIAVGDELAVRPGRHEVRVRALESHQVDFDRATPGRRLAANLVGIQHRQIARGQALVRPGEWHRTERFDASLTVLGSLDHSVNRRGAYAVYVGTGEFPVRMRVLGSKPIEPGDTGLVRIWLGLPDGIPLTPGDRFVLREAGRFETVGGGEVLDVEPTLPASKATPDRSLERVIAERGWVAADELFRLTGQQVQPTLGRWVVDPAASGAVEEKLIEKCQEAGAAGIDLAQLGERERAVLSNGSDALEVQAEAVYLKGSAPQGLSDHAQRVLAELEQGGWSPPTLPLTDRGALRELQRAKLAVECSEAWFSAGAVDSAASAVAELLADHPEGISVADARDRLGTSRKHVVPLLTYLDSVGFTSRRGDIRIAGRRMTAGRLGPS